MVEKFEKKTTVTFAFTRQPAFSHFFYEEKKTLRWAGFMCGLCAFITFVAFLHDLN